MKSRIRSSKSCTFVLLFTLFLCAHSGLGGQISRIMLTGAALNGIPTSVPFLTIAPDGRSSGMGDGGVATMADVNSQHWNVAKYAFADSKKGVALSYTPWITNLIPDVNHFYLSAFYKLDSKNTLSSSFRYFSLGTITFGGGTAGTQYQPQEFALDAGYSRKITDHF